MQLSLQSSVSRYERRRGVKETESAPTLIIVPAQLLPQTFSEAQANFPELNFHSFFGSRNGIPTTNPRHAATRATNELDELMCTWASARDDPNTATNVVFTSYSTMYRRWFRPFPVRFDPTRDWAPWVFDRLVKFTEDPSGQGSAGPDTQMADPTTGADSPTNIPSKSSLALDFV